MRLISILFLCFISLTGIAQNPQIVASTISEVTVFSEGAQVTRSASVNLKKGPQTLVFNQLTQNLQEQSLQLKASGNFTILSVSAQQNYLANSPKSEKIVALQAKIEALDIELENIQAKASSLELEREVLEANKTLGGSSGYSTTELQNTVRFMQQKRQQNAEEWYALVRNQKKKQAEQRKLNQQLAQEQKSFSEKNKQVIVKLEAPSAGPANFSFSYLVNQASWQSNYDLRVQSLDKPLALTHKAQIQQSTGEDWSQVNLTLATGNPQAGARLPNIRPWYVAKMTPQNRQYQTLYDAELEEVQMAATAKSATRGARAKNIGVNQSENITLQEYRIEKPFSLSSSYSAETVILRELSLPATYSYQVSPRQDLDAFLVAKVYNWNRLKLLSGNMALYNGDTYVGQNYLNTQNVQDTLVLSLGRDKGITVKREQVFANTSKVFLGSDKIDNYTFKISIRNGKGKAVSITLKDQVPVSQNDEVKVKVEEINGGTLEPSTGIITWRLNINSQKSATQSFSYQIRYPKGQPIHFY